MKALDTEITHDGRTLTQLRRTAKTAIYELRGESGLIYGYEVIKIRVQKERRASEGSYRSARSTLPIAIAMTYISLSRSKCS